jgi:hypothetical protein
MNLIIITRYLKKEEASWAIGGAFKPTTNSRPPIFLNLMGDFNPFTALDSPLKLDDEHLGRNSRKERL